MDDASEQSKTALKGDDTFAAIAIVIVTLLAVLFAGGYTLYKHYKQKVSAKEKAKKSEFTPPIQRKEFLDAKEKLNINDPSEKDELKKYLMKRAYHTIPILLQLQNEGNSIEKLYRRGILTDDMHYKLQELKTYFDEEFKEVQAEAEDLMEGWGSHIWQQAMQYYQLVLKQEEDRNEAARIAEEEKRKLALEKKKEKERAKKAALREGKNEVVDSTPIDPEVLKAQEAERIAKELIEAEEKEKKKNTNKPKTKK